MRRPKRATTKRSNSNHLNLLDDLPEEERNEWTRLKFESLKKEQEVENLKKELEIEKDDNGYCKS